MKNPLAYLQDLLKLAKDLGDKIGEARACNNLGIAYDRLGYSKTAIYYHARQLEIAKELGDRAGEENAYGNLGNAHYKLGNFKTVIDYSELQLKLAKESGDKSREGSTYGNIGAAYDRLGDFKMAKNYHELHLRIAKEVGDKTEEGLACRHLGKTYYILEDFSKAIHFLNLGLNISKEVGDRAGEGKAYCYLGAIYRILGDLEKAIEYHEFHLKVSKEVGSKEGEGNAYGNLGNVYHSLGEFRKAKHYLELRLKFAKDVEDRVGEGSTYGNLGTVYCSLGEFKKARDYFDLHLKIAIEVGDKAGEGSACGNLGIACYSLGDFKTAIDYHERHLEISKELENKVGEGSAYSNLGIAYDSLGDFKRAIEYHKLHLKISRELGYLNGERCAYNNLGIAYRSLPDFKNAMHNLQGSLKLAKQMGSKAAEANANGNIGIVHYSLGDVKKAIEYYELHLKIVKDLEDRTAEGNAYGNLGSAYYCLKDFEKVICYEELHLKIAKETGDKLGEAKIFNNLGCTFESQGFLVKATDCYQSSVRILNDIRNNLEKKDDWKICIRDLYQFVYTSLWRLLLMQGKVVEALEAAEEGRAQALKDLIQVNYTFEPAHFDSHELEETMSYGLSCRSSNIIFTAVDDQEIFFWVTGHGNDVHLRRNCITDPKLLDVTTFLKSLIKNAYSEIGVRSEVKCEDRSLDEPRDEKVTADSSDQQLKSPSVLQPTHLRTLYDFVIGPVVDLIHGEEIIFIPEGPLCLVPYAAFVDSDSKYLSESYRIRVIPSLTSLRLIEDSPVDYHYETGALLVGDPWVQEYTYKGRKLVQLPCAREEVEVIGQILHTEPLTGTEATKDAVLERLSSVALVHIAAHGRMETGEIALAPNPTRASQTPTEEDFLLTMKDVSSVQIRAKLVVLSCCHSGRGEIKAEGVVGIARAFMGAGARSVLVSLWAIDDEATLEFMKSFYEHLAERRSASDALNRAMKCMRESDKFNKVKYWAPFVLVGDDVTLEFGSHKHDE